MNQLLDVTPDKTVCIIGLGYVGLTLAVTMAECGFRVVGVEKRQDVVENLRKGLPHFYEPNLVQVMSRVKEFGRISFHTTIPDEFAIDIYIITVGTPLGDDGLVRLDMVRNAVLEVAKHAKPGVMVIMRSTLKFGTTRKIVAPMLDDAGIKYDLAFCPERTIEGHALQELRVLPQIVGGLTDRATNRAAQIFQIITPTVVRVSNPETAEMVKMIDNAQRDVAFAYSNEIARICDTSGISGVEVIQAGKLGYPRTNLFMPGPVGGPCLSKDSYILAEGLNEFGISPEITLAARRTNERQSIEVAKIVEQLFVKMTAGTSRPKNISLLGLAFKGKPATDDLRGTTAKNIFDVLQRHFPEAAFRGYDAMVSAKEIANFGVDPKLTLEEVFEGADLVMVLNNHQAFSTMDIGSLASSMKKPGLIYDFWNHFDARTLLLPKGVGYASLGALAHAVIPNIKEVKQ